MGAIFGLSADTKLSQEDIQKFVKLMTELGVLDKVTHPSLPINYIFLKMEKI